MDSVMGDGREGRPERREEREFLSEHGIVRSAIREDLLQFALPAILVLGAGAAVTVWDLTRRPGELDILSANGVGGIALVVAGFAIVLLGYAALGRYYSSTLVIRHDHQLVINGIYRFIRHPIYLGTITVFIGLPLFASSTVGILISLALIPVFLRRIDIEERLLCEEFGEAYRAYQERTRKLVPFVY